MLDALARVSERERRETIAAHWETLLSDGFIGFVQGQIEAARRFAEGGTGTLDELLAGLDPAISEAVRQRAAAQLPLLAAVWQSMTVVYQHLQRVSEQQSPHGGMVSHGSHTVMPRGLDVGGAVHCYRCGSAVADRGLCAGCLATEQDWHEKDLEHDWLEDQRRELDLQRDELQHRSLSDDQIYHDNQMDFSTGYHDPH